MEPSFSWMDPNANLYHLSRPLIRNVRNETQSDGKSKDWFQRYIYIYTVIIYLGYLAVDLSECFAFNSGQWIPANLTRQLSRTREKMVFRRKEEEDG